MRHIRPIVVAALGSLALTACGSAPDKAPKPTAVADSSEAESPATEATAWPASLRVMGDGYPKPGDACRRLGESAATADFLDDSAILVGCFGDAAEAPTAAMVALGGHVVGKVEGISLVSLPQGDANVGMNPDTPTGQSPKGRTN